jgi:hypothetical protein
MVRHEPFTLPSSSTSDVESAAVGDWPESVQDAIRWTRDPLLPVVSVNFGGARNVACLYRHWRIR